MKYFFLGILISSSAANAQLGNAAGSYTSADNLEGFCTTLNKEHPYFKEGICTSLVEQLRYDKCTAPLLEKLRKRMEGTLEGKIADPKERFSAGFECSSRQGGGNWSKIVKDKAVFGTVVAQMLASTMIAESGWDTFYNLSKESGKNINQGKQGGVANLTLARMEDPKYSKGGDGNSNCGCRVTNSKGAGGTIEASIFWRLLLGDIALAQSQNENKLKTGNLMWTEGDSPGPRDPHHSIQCAAHILLVEADEDGAFFGGMRKDPNTTPTNTATPRTPAQDDPNKPVGGSKVWDTLKEWARQAGQILKPDDLAVNPKLNMIKKKLKLYCERTLNEEGQMQRTFDQDFPGGGTALREI